MSYRVDAIRPLLNSNKEIPIATLKATPIHAVAGIGYPAGFFDQLRALGLTLITHVFPDHYVYSAQDITFPDPYNVLMTEKDAVKCRAFASERHFCVSITAELDDVFEKGLTDKLRGL